MPGPPRTSTTRVRTHLWIDRIRATAAGRAKQAAKFRQAAWKRLCISNPPPDSAPGNCELCGIFCTRLNLDHDHATHLFRGWLCPNCNAGLGQFQDDPNVLRLAAEYLERKEQIYGA